MAAGGRTGGGVGDGAGAGRELPEYPGVPFDRGLGLAFPGERAADPRRTAAELAARLSPDASKDLLDWGPAGTPEAQFRPVMEGEVTLDSLLDADRAAPVLTDDRPVNEYYFLRRTFRRKAALRVK